MGDTILVTGATGAQGRALTRRLLDRGAPVRAVTRNPDKPAARALAAAGAELVAADMNDEASLRRACAGVHGVFAVQNFWEKGVGYQGEIEQGCRLARAAADNEVAHFVQTSVAGCDRAPDVHHFHSKYVIEQYLDELQLPRTFLREVFFMENFFEPVVGGSGKRAIDPSLTLRMLDGALRKDLSFHMVTVDDIAWFADDIFKHPQQYLGTKLDVASDSLTVDEMKAVYASVLARPAPRVPLPLRLTRLLNAEMGRQLDWNNRVGWHFDLAPLRQRHPGLTRFGDFLQARRTASRAGVGESAPG